MRSRGVEDEDEGGVGHQWVVTVVFIGLVKSDTLFRPSYHKPSSSSTGAHHVPCRQFPGLLASCSCGLQAGVVLSEYLFAPRFCWSLRHEAADGLALQPLQPPALSASRLVIWLPLQSARPSRCLCPDVRGKCECWSVGPLG